MSGQRRVSPAKGSGTQFCPWKCCYTGHIAMYRWWHFLAESAARALPFPKSQRPTCPFSFTPGGTPPARLSADPSLPGVSRFRRFRCYLDLPPALHGLLRYPSPPGVSLFWRFRSYLNSPPAMHGPLRHPPLPGVSLFRCFRCYLGRPPAPHGPLRHPPLPSVTQAPGPALWRQAPGNRQPPAMLLC